MKQIPESERVGLVFGKTDSEKFRAWLLLRVNRATKGKLPDQF